MEKEREDGRVEDEGRLERVRKRVAAEAWLAALRLSGGRQPAQGIIEYALVIVVLAAVASIGLAAAGTDLQTLFTGLGSKLKTPAGF